MILAACGESPQTAKEPTPVVDSNLVYHFGYGSNLSGRFMREHCPNVQFVMKGYLPNYRVEFRFYSENRKGGISSIMEAPGEMTHGVIYSMPKKEMEDLDVLESVPEGLYKRETFLVLGDDGKWLEADLYRVSNPEGPFTPAKSYLDLMIEGAREHGLDPDYIEKLESMRRALE
jgi:cation transport regulator ChaC